jgi:hypothetical protein
MTQPYDYGCRMGMPVRVTAVIVMCLGLAGCVKTTEGSVAMTTEPGSATSTSTSSPSRTTSRPTTQSSPTRTTSTSEVPAPPGAMTMKCSEFTKLDQPTRLAVVKEILSEENSAFGPLGDDFAETMANTMCDFMPEMTVREILTGSPPP